MFQKQIEKLAESSEWYVISPFYRTYGEDTEFSELEDYLLETYKTTFAEKFSIIVVKLICLHEAYVEFNKFFPREVPMPFRLPQNRDIRNVGLEKIVATIEYIIKKGGASINIYFKDFNSLINIGEDFDNAVYSENKEFLEDVKILVAMEGLYIRHIS